MSDAEYRSWFLRCMRACYPHMDRLHEEAARKYGAPRRHGRQGTPRRYGRWVTIGAVEGEDGKRHGGSPVYIEDGKIVKGHPSLTGRHLDRMAEPAEHTTTHRQDLHQEKEYNRAVWAKRARQAGISANDLHSLATEIRGHDAAFKKEHTKMLQTARKRLGEFGGGKGLNLLAARGVDASSIRGLDDVAADISLEYPHHFGPHDTPSDRLWELLVAGNPEPMSEDQAYQEAFDQLQAEKERHQTAGDDGSVPFARGSRP
jgi:hypothetical protein